MESVAGTIWDVLACNGAVSLDWLCEATKLTPADANRGIGWLAREGRLSLERRTRRGEVRVAEAAEKVRQVLYTRGPMQLTRAVQVTALPEDLAHQGLGWLAREGRVRLRRWVDGREVEVGRAAGAIWRLVRARGAVACGEVSEATGLPAGLANEAIGWLVREGKLVVEEPCVERSAVVGANAPAMAMAGRVASRPGSDSGISTLECGRSSPPEASGPASSGGTLRLEAKGKGREIPVGEAAGCIWQSLHARGRLSANELSRETGLPDGPLNQGVGWLAREGKLCISLDRKGHEWFKLKGSRNGE